MTLPLVINIKYHRQTHLSLAFLHYSCILRNTNKPKILHVSPSKLNFIPVVTRNGKVKEGRKRKNDFLNL